MENFTWLHFLILVLCAAAAGAYGFHRGVIFGIGLRVTGMPLVIRIEEVAGIFYGYEWVDGKFLGQNETIAALTLEISKKFPKIDIIPVLLVAV